VPLDDAQAGGPEQDHTQIDTTVPQSARIYDYWLGGKDNFAPDRAVAEALATQIPTIRTMVRSQRVFLVRAVDYLVRKAGIRQFLDIGTGIPSLDNVLRGRPAHRPGEPDPVRGQTTRSCSRTARALMTSTRGGPDRLHPRRPPAGRGTSWLSPALRETPRPRPAGGAVPRRRAAHLHDSDDPRGIVSRPCSRRSRRAATSR
jgi:hypothetical protein